MASWREEYMQNLKDRDHRDKVSYRPVDAEFIAAYTNLIDHTAFLEAERAVPAASPSGTVSRDASHLPDSNDTTAQIRLDLAEALRSNGQLQARIKTAESELLALRLQTKSDAQLIDGLSKDRAKLARKLKDRDEELRGKTKLLDDIHDETISINLQLNMAEKRVEVLKAENKELIDRWMAEKGREADKMNMTLQAET